MASTYTYGQGTEITVINDDPSAAIYIYNYDVTNNKIIQINGLDYVTVGGGDSEDISIPTLSSTNQDTYRSAGLFFSQSRPGNSL